MECFSFQHRLTEFIEQFQYKLKTYLFRESYWFIRICIFFLQIFILFYSYYSDIIIFYYHNIWMRYYAARSSVGLNDLIRVNIWLSKMWFGQYCVVFFLDKMIISFNGMEKETLAEIMKQDPWWFGEKFLVKLYFLYKRQSLINYIINKLHQSIRRSFSAFWLLRRKFYIPARFQVDKYIFQSRNM